MMRVTVDVEVDDLMFAELEQRSAGMCLFPEEYAELVLLRLLNTGVEQTEQIETGKEEKVLWPA